MADDTNHDDLIRRLKEAVEVFNGLLQEAEDVGLPLGITFPLRADSVSLSVWQYDERGSWPSVIGP